MMCGFFFLTYLLIVKKIDADIDRLRLKIDRIDNLIKINQKQIENRFKSLEIDLEEMMMRIEGMIIDRKGKYR